MDTYFLNTEDYDFSFFREGGFSGTLYLASDKQDPSSKLLVKHQNPCSACNEFMYARLAQLLDIPASDTYLFRVAKEDSRRFKSPFVVGIRYIDGLRAFTREEVRQSPSATADYAAHYALAVLFHQDDLIQLSMDPNGRIIGFDFTECFNLTELSLNGLLHSPELGLRSLLNNLQSFRDSDFQTKAASGAKVLANHLNAVSIEDIYPIYHKVMKQFCQLSPQKLETLYDALDEIYPIEVSVYFEEYLAELQWKIQTYLSNIK